MVACALVAVGVVVRVVVDVGDGAADVVVVLVFEFGRRAVVGAGVSSGSSCTAVEGAGASVGRWEIEVDGVMLDGAATGDSVDGAGAAVALDDAAEGEAGAASTRGAVLGAVAAVGVASTDDVTTTRSVACTASVSDRPDAPAAAPRVTAATSAVVPTTTPARDRRRRVERARRGAPVTTRGVGSGGRAFSGSGATSGSGVGTGSAAGV